MEINKLSDKVLLYLARNKKQGKTKKWLSDELNISRPTLDDRINHNNWYHEEYIKLKLLGIA